MRNHAFKVSAIAATIAASFGAQAALYNVVEINESATDAYGLGGYKTEYHGTSVESATVPGGNPLGCFDNTYSCPDSKISAETRNWPAGLSYREEVPFAMDNGFDYSIYDRDDFENYCDGQLGYATCDTWANKQSEGYEKERTDSLYTNSIAFIEGQDAVSAENTVINSISSDVLPVGNKRVGTLRNQAFSSMTLTGLGTTPAIVATHAWKTDGTYTVGSVSRERGNDEGTWFYSKAVIWTGSSATELNFANGGHDISDNRLSQASIRDFTIDNGTFYGVGYNTYGDQRMDATIYSVDVANIADADKITSTPVSGATSGSDYIFTNSVVSSINQNKVAVGSAKLSKGNPLDGAAANRLFFVEDVTAPTATYFAGALFANKGGTIGAINNFNEVVGSVDITSGREIDGTPRVQRGFINPYIAADLTGNNELRANIFEKQAWLLDDLTNGIDENNEFRVINASDINDAGVISATALKCDGGYDTTDIDSYCKNGEFGVEKVVAVKLIPIAEESTRDIQARGFRTTKVERSGASLGWLALGLLTLLGFRRK